MTYKRKTKDVWILYGNYGCGWEEELREYSYKEGRDRLREYRLNCGTIYKYKLEKHRERIIGF